MQLLKVSYSLTLSLMMFSCQAPSVIETNDTHSRSPQISSTQSITVSELEKAQKKEAITQPPQRLPLKNDLTPDVPASSTILKPVDTEAIVQDTTPEGPCLLMDQCLIDTFSGDGIEGYQGDLSGLSVRFRNPTFMVTDSEGNVYISDTDNHRVRRIDVQTGQIKTVAGNGEVGFNGDKGLAINAQLNTPKGLAIDVQGYLYIVDSKNHRVRRVNLKMGSIDTVAGNGFQGFTGDDVLPENSALNAPEGIAFDGKNAIFIADHNNQRIRKLDLALNTIETVVGNGLEGFTKDGSLALKASLRNPTHLTVDGENLYFSESGNQRIRKVNLISGQLSTLVGSGEQGFNPKETKAYASSLRTPSGLLVSDGYLYFADKGNHRVRKVNLKLGDISNVAGIGSAGFSGDKKDSQLSELKFPLDLSMNHKGELLILDTGNQRVRLLHYRK